MGSLVLPVLAVVQIPARTSLSPEEFEGLLLDGARQARDRGGELVLFPGYLGLCLLREGWTFREGLGPALAGAADLRRIYLNAAARVARIAGVYLVPGSLVEPGPAGWGHACYLISPAGEVLGRRFQLHVTPEEERRGLAGGTAVEAVATPWGKVGFLLGTDVRYPEVGRILALQGARLLLCPAAHPAPVSPWRQVAGAWREAQANQVYAAEACLTGELGGLTFGGRSAVYGPNEATPGESGWLARTERAEEILVVSLDPCLADRIRRYRVLELMEPAVFARELPPAYARLKRDEGR